MHSKVSDQTAFSRANVTSSILSDEVQDPGDCHYSCKFSIVQLLQFCALHLESLFGTNEFVHHEHHLCWRCATKKPISSSPFGARANILLLSNNIYYVYNFRSAARNNYLQRDEGQGIYGT